MFEGHLCAVPMCGPVRLEHVALISVAVVRRHLLSYLLMASLGILWCCHAPFFSSRLRFAFLSAPYTQARRFEHTNESVTVAEAVNIVRNLT